jgi:nucleotide-binding universal stress UspA family protein
VVTVADIWPPSEEPPDAALERAVPFLARARARAREMIRQARATADRGAERLKKILPGWRVSAEGVADSPAWALFKKAREMEADLVVVGARGRSRQIFPALGSVSQKVLAECGASVRIGRTRAREGAHARLLLALDGSPEADRAAAQVLSRRWPAGTSARVMAVADERLRHPASLRLPALRRWAREGDTDDRAWLGRMVESWERRLIAAGLTVSGRVETGDPKRVLVEKAARWGADVIFLGARGLSRWERRVLGSVSAAVAARAPCSVEVVRSVS